MSNQKANVRKEIEAIYPLSSMQEGMLFHALFAPESELYFLQQTADFYGTFNDTVFRQAWQLLAQRHPILRTFFVWEKQKQPIQVVRRRAAIPVETLDWCDLPTDEQTAQWQSLLTEDRAVGFELNKTPIHRVKLVRLGEEQHRLVWSYHHILQDGWTTNLLFRELFQLYDGLFQGETIELALVRPYQTFIRWLGQQDKTADESFWRDYLREFSAPTPLNVDRKVGQQAHQSTVYDELRFQLTHEMANRLQAFARDHRLTLSNLIQGAWAILLSRYSGAEDVLYGTTFSGRSARLQGIEEIAGVFINTLPIRARVESGTEVVTWLKEFQQNQLVLQQYEHTPLVTIQGWSEVSKDQSLFDSLIVFENYPQSEGLGQESGLRVQRHSTEERTNYPLTVRMLPTAASIHFFFIYDQERFDAATIKRMFAHWQTLLNAILDQPDEPVAQLNMLTPPELDQLLHTWNHSDLQFRPEMCIHQRVAQQAAQTPDKPALTFEAEMLTYRQLNERANQLAHHLQTQGIQPDDLVALYLERSLHTVIAILAVLKAGGAYLPMDTAYPQERLAFMLEDSEASLVLTTADLRLTIEPSLSNLICLDSDWQIIATRPTHNPSSDVQPHNRAYVIYTSGSTGKPKGVLVTHHNVMRLFQATDHWYNFSADDVWTLFHSYAFDFSVWEIWGALLYGGRVVVVPYMTSRSPQDFYNLLCHEGVTVLNQTPSAFRQLIQAEEMVGVDDRLRLRSVIFGGEALELNSLQPWFERHDDERPQLINMYGITETTVHVTYRPITKQDLVRAPGSVIGRQIPDLQIYILDQNQQPVPIGVPGEIYVGGAGVAAGYLNRPELTAERFVQLSVISEKLNTDYQILNTVYRTGDLARRLPDGDIEYLGRIDHQVKIRGFRIELGEIEAALGGHSGVREVLVLARGEGGEKQLVAYFVPNTVDDESLGVSELRNYLQPKLPIYMIPATFVRLQAFPLTTNGKIDRRALPQPDDARLETERPFTPPRTPAEETLTNIFSRVLNVARVGIDDNYFELGGDSIRSIQVLSQARQAGLNFSLADLFNLQTVARLCEQIARSDIVEAAVEATEAAPFSLISDADRTKLPASVEDAYPLSKLQAGMLFHAELEAETAVYHNVKSWHIQAVFNEEMLKTAVQQLAQKHTVLRSGFDFSSYSEPLQLVWSQVQIPVNLHDLRHLDDNGQEAEIGRWVKQAIAKKFDWTQPPLLRFRFLQRSDNSFQMIMVEHHAILDGWSVASLLTELLQTYHGLLAGTAVSTAESVPYRNFVAAEQKMLASAAARTFWQERLAESNISTIPRLPLPKNDEELLETDTATGSMQTVYQTIIPKEQVTKLNQVAQRAGVPLKSVLLAAHLKVLGFVSGQNDVMSGLVMNGRTEQSGSERALGLFLNTVPVRQKLAAGSWLDLIRQTFASEKAILPYRRFPLAEMQQMLGGQPLFEVPFNFLHFHVLDAIDNEITILNEQFFGHTNFALAVEVELNSADGTLALRLEYEAAEFTVSQIESLAGYFERTLTAMAANPEAAQHQFSPLSAAERQQLLVDWNQTGVPLPQFKLVHELIAEQANNHPETTALIFGQQQMSYGELNGRSNQLARALQANGIGPESKVGLFTKRSFEMVVAVLAVFKAGGAYVPLDPAYPPDRLVYMVADSGMTTILTTESLLPMMDGYETAVLCLDRDWDEQIGHHSDTNPVSGATVDNLAYIIYTSGSTGRPKGVAVTHRGLVNMGQALGQLFAISRQSRILQFASFSFDASVAEMVVALQNGIALVLATSEDLLMGPSFVQLMQQQKVTVATLPPSALALLSPDDFPLLETIVSVGEACSAEVVARWATEKRFINGYGPTEGTVGAITAVLNPNDPRPVIGRPLPNYKVYMLNEQLQPVPVGVLGEIHIAGMGLARGYLNRPQLTAEKFVSNLFANNDGDRMYKTGDLGRYLADGRIEFMGRVDHQVQIRGFRIELGEVESALRQHRAVQDVLVLAKDNDGDAQLVAYVVGDEEGLGDLRPFLSRSLPAYMIPAVFILLESFPLTPNGKIDRKALPAPDGQLGGSFNEVFIAPQDALESQLAQIWQDILKMPTISTDANYFEIGGHSLQAVTLFAAIEKKIRLRLPVSLLFQAPTIGSLATAIREQGEVAKWSSLVPIQPLGAKTPFFCVHGGAGHVFHYHDLAQQMGKERPFYGLQPIMNETTHQSIYNRVEEMAAKYIEEIKMVQPEGPYLLGGFCFGGIVVYEIAQQLTKAGDEVGLLAFIDPTSPQNKPDPEAETPEFLAARMARHQKNMAQLGRLARLRYIVNSGKNRMVGFWFLLYRAWLRDWRIVRAKLFQKYIDWRPSVPSRWHDFYFMHLIVSPATEHYYPRQYMGEAILFSSTLENAKDEFLGWENLPQTGVKLYRVESTHLELLKRPFIDQVAKKINQHLEPFA